MVAVPLFKPQTFSVMITFKEIKQGGIVHVLDKDAMTARPCKVQAVSFPHIDIQQQPSQGMVVDVTLEMDGKVATYVMSETASVTFAGNLVLATEQQALCATIEQMKQDAERILASVEQQKEVLARADKLLTSLNPALRERQQTEQRFRALESNVSSVDEKVDKLLRLLESKAL